MPKAAIIARRRWGAAPVSVPAAPPRMVSFEDGHDVPTSDTPANTPGDSAAASTRIEAKLGLSRRPTSKCLSSMALEPTGASHCGESPTTKIDITTSAHAMYIPYPLTGAQATRSETKGRHVSKQRESRRGCSSLDSNGDNWGHFVNIVSDLDGHPMAQSANKPRRRRHPARNDEDRCLHPRRLRDSTNRHLERRLRCRASPYSVFANHLRHAKRLCPTISTRRLDRLVDRNLHQPMRTLPSSPVIDAPTVSRTCHPPPLSVSCATIRCASSLDPLADASNLITAVQKLHVTDEARTRPAT